MDKQDTHNQENHLNIYTLDHDSIVTGKGIHDRVVAFVPMYDLDYDKICLYCRVDTIHGLGIPTEKQILSVARKDQGVKGRFKLIEKSGLYGNFGSIDFIFEKL